MSPEHTWFWVSTLLIYPLWGSLGYLLARRRYLVLWDPAGYHVIRHPTLTIAAYWFHRGTWLLIMTFSMCYLYRQAVAGVDTAVWLALLCTVPLILDAGITAHFARREHKVAGREGAFQFSDCSWSESDPFWPIRLFGIIVAIAVLILILQLHIAFPIAMLGTMGFWCDVKGRKCAIEDTSLLSEFRSIAGHFDKLASNVLVIVPDNQSNSTSRIRHTVGLRIGSRDVCYHIPLQSFQTLSPSTLSAAYALNLADTCFYFLWCPILTAFGGCALAAVLMRVLGFERSHHNDFLWDVAVGSAAMMGATAGRVRSYLGPRGAKTYANAYVAWIGASEPGTRSLEDFLAALAENLSFRRQIHDRDILWLVLLRTPGIVALVRKHGMEPEAVIRRAMKRATIGAE